MDWKKLWTIRAQNQSGKNGWVWQFALWKAVLLTAWEGAAMAAFTALLGVAFPQFADIGFSLGWSYLILAPLLDLLTGAVLMAAVAKSDSRRAGAVTTSARRQIGKIAGTFLVSIMFKIGGYLAFYSLAAAVYADWGSRDVANDITAIQLYRSFMAPISGVITGYYDDVAAGLVSSAIGGLIVGLFKR